MTTDEYEELPEDHFQYAWPSIQVGRLRNEPQNHYVCGLRRGPVATIRANMFKAEGAGRNTGLIMDEICPRRIMPIECARIHGFTVIKQPPRGLLQKTQTTKLPDLAVVACTPFWSFCAGQRRIDPGQITDGT